MSKSSNNDDINIAYLEKLTDIVSNLAMDLEKISPNYGNNGQLEKVLTELSKHVQSGDMTLKQMLKEAANTQKNIRSVEYGIEDTARYGRTINTFVKLLEAKIGNSKLDDVLLKKVATAFNNLDVTAILESEKIGQRGGKGAPLKNVMDNEKLDKVNADLARRIGVKLDDSMSKLMTFYQEEEKKTAKRTAGFVQDLIEGLGKSKWVGGTLRDTFKLIGLLGANWLSQFGQLGKILGGAFYIAMETAGPFLVSLLLKGLGGVLGKLVGGLGGALGRLIGIGGTSAASAGAAGAGAAGAGAAGASGAGAVGGLAAKAGTVVARGAGAIGLGAGAFFAGRESINSFKEGDKVGGSAFGAGALGLGVAAIAALVAGISAPVTLIAGAIGGIAVAVGAIWKNREAILDHFKKHKDFYDRILKFIDFVNPVFGLLRSICMWWQDKYGGESAGERSNAEDSLGNKNGVVQKVANFLNVQDKKPVQKIEGSGINKAGYVTNLKSLTPMQASKVLKAYYDNYNEQATNAYDWMKVGEFYPHLYKNDAAIRDAKGNAILVPSYKGARQDLQDMNAKLSSIGLSGMALSGSMRTAGRTGVTHVKGSKHDNIMGLVNDYAAGWTDDASWFKAFEALRPMMKEKGFDLYYEGYDSKGKRHMTNDLKKLGTSDFQGLSGRHFHVQRLRGLENLARSTDPMKNVEATKARAEQQSIELSKIAKSVEPELYQKYEREIEKGKEDSALKNLEKQMRDQGYYFNDEAKQWTKKKGNGLFGANQKEGTLIEDATGNYKFERISAIIGGMEVGLSNGRIV